MSKHGDRKRPAHDTACIDLILQAAEIVERESASSPHERSNSDSSSSTRKRFSSHGLHRGGGYRSGSSNHFMLISEDLDELHKPQALSAEDDSNGHHDGYEADSETTAVAKEKRPSLLRKHFIITKREGSENESINSESVISKREAPQLDMLHTKHVQPVKPPRGRPALVVDELEPVRSPKHRRTSVSPRFNSTGQLHHQQHQLIDQAIGPGSRGSTQTSSISSISAYGTAIGTMGSITFHAPGLMDRDAREMHNISEKNRRAHLKNCFEELRERVPNMAGKRCSNLTILKGAGRYIFALNRREREYQAEVQQLLLEKLALEKRRQRLSKRLIALGVDPQKVKVNISRNASTSPVADKMSNGQRNGSPAASEPLISNGKPKSKSPKNGWKTSKRRSGSRSDSATNSDPGEDRRGSNTDSSTSTASEGEEGEDREDEATDEASEYGDIEPPPEFLRNLPFRKRFHRLMKDVDGCVVTSTQQSSNPESVTSVSPSLSSTATPPPVMPVVTSPPSTPVTSPNMSVLQRTLTQEQPMSTAPAVVQATETVTDSGPKQLNPQFFNQNIHGVYELLANVQQKERQQQVSASPVAVTVSPTQRSLIATLTVAPQQQQQTQQQQQQQQVARSLLPSILSSMVTTASTATTMQPAVTRTVATVDMADLSQLLAAASAPAPNPAPSSAITLAPELVSRLLAAQQLRQIQQQHQQQQQQQQQQTATAMPLIFPTQVRPAPAAPAAQTGAQLLQTLLLQQVVNRSSSQPPQQPQTPVGPVFLVPVIPTAGSTAPSGVTQTSAVQVTTQDLSTTAGIMNLLSNAVIATPAQTQMNRNAT